MNYHDMRMQESERYARNKWRKPTPKVQPLPLKPIQYKATHKGREIDFEVPTVTVECVFVYTDERPPQLIHTEIVPRLPLDLLRNVAIRIAKDRNLFFHGNLSKWIDQRLDDEGRGYTSTTVYPANWRNKRRGLIRIRNNETGRMKL